MLAYIENIIYNRTSCALEAIKFAVSRFSDINIGAGTVINTEQAEKAIESGGFMVSPKLSEDVAKYCRGKNIPYYPKCVTPTKIMKALEFGITVVKFFRPIFTAV